MLIADHFIHAEPVNQGSMVFKATRVNSSLSAVQVFPFDLTDQQREDFAQQMILLAKATTDYRASIPALLGWGFTKSESFPYIETEWINGVPLDVSTTSENGTVLSVPEVMVMAEQVARSLSIYEQLGLQHGAVKPENILWERSRDRYVLVGLNLMNGVFGNEQTNENALPQKTTARSASSQPNDVYDFGQLLFQLLKAHGAQINFSEAIENKLPVGQTSVDEKNIPAWLVNTTRRCLSPNPKLRFGSAAELYNYVLSHHTTQVQKETWYRSKPQQDVPPGTLSPGPVASPKKLKPELQLSPVQKKKLLTISPYILAGLLIAVLITAFSMNAYKKERLGTNDADTGMATDTMEHKSGDTSTLANDQSKTEIPQATQEKKSKVPAKKPATVVLEKHHNRVEKIAPPVTGLGAYKVRSKAHFHNQPDESTRRDAFIVHWNKAVLHPSEERNDFVYIVFTNHEGQTSKGWLRKKDLVKVDE